MMQVFSKASCWIVVFTLLGPMLLLHVGALAAEGALGNAQYNAALLMDVETGQVLYEEHPHEQLIPASLVKMMVSLLVLERLETGTLHLSDIVTVSAWASQIGGQQVYLAEGETFTLEELLKAMTIASANDAATAVAEFLAGDADACVELMNTRAKELGMQDTTFANVHGLPPDKGQKENYTSAYDIAILGRELLKHPQILTWTSTVEDTFRNGTFILTNTNRQLMRQYRGIDGLKTGYHGRGAGFNVCVTAKRQDRRLLAVVLGASSKVDRTRAVVDLLDMGFQQFQEVVVLRKGFTIDEPMPVVKGKTRSAAIIASQNAVVLVEKGREADVVQNIQLSTRQMTAPVRRGTKVGEAVISVGGQPITRVDLVVDEDVEKGSLLDRLKWWFVDIIS